MLFSIEIAQHNYRKYWKNNGNELPQHKLINRANMRKQIFCKILQPRNESGFCKDYSPNNFNPMAIRPKEIPRAEKL